MPTFPTRRRFLTASAASGAAIAFPSIIPTGVLAADERPAAGDRLQIAHIGVGGRGTGLLKDTLKHKECDVVAVCDVDQKHLERAAKLVGGSVKTYGDYRKLLEDKSIDAVVIGAPDHWHALMTVQACQAGKDVYCEKPACNTIAEGLAMIRATKEHKRVVQIGSQGRSQPDAVAACEFLRNGQIGRVSRVNCWHALNPEGGFAPDSDPPPSLNWDLWLGPAAARPYNPAYHPFGFRWFLDLGGGNIRDRRAHIFSVALWCMNADNQAPVSVEALGAPPRKGLYNCPTLMQVTYEFKNPDWTLVWSQPGEKPGKKDYGAWYHGDKGSLWVEGGDGGVTVEPKAKEFHPGSGDPTVFHSPGHFQNFLDCIKSRQKPHMDIESAVTTANLCVIGNLSYRLKRKLNWDGVNHRFIDDDDANRYLSNPPRGEWTL